ncbi:hypothetical protein OL239_01585 [Arthrobacter sp. ATA002]|uniref:hypothetical protein n=1 Tax=Arthrobacter sp. ATA002 TaxID=2991715 RepID=UPI0022A6F971|nr:hypothetical protein [Arthrobacter sp. ATA002]WAP52044.1 hypothetical protein OL239_01585 [Arthrobacter sp. ATA002]
MTDHPWPTEVSDSLRTFLTEAFPGVQFHAVPLVAYDVATIDLAWTDGPSLHEVDLLALDFVLRIHLDVWGTRTSTSIDRVSSRRTMSPAAEQMLLNMLAEDMALSVPALDMNRVYSLPPLLSSSRYRVEKGTIAEFLDLLFEATSFSFGRAVGNPPAALCSCTLCA